VASRAEALAPSPADARRVLASPDLASRVREVRAAADLTRSRPIAVLPEGGREAFLRTGDRLGFEGPYFERRRSLVALGLASWLWREAGDLVALARLVEAICAESRWALPAHEDEVDLFAGETAFAFAEISACLEGDLDPGVAALAAAEAERRVLAPFAARADAWSWERMRNNWCAVCGGSIGSAAIYLLGEGPRLEAILSRIAPTLERFLESFAEDGACLEGLGYWTYGVGFYAAFADLLARFAGGSVRADGGGSERALRDLMSSEKFRRIASFQSKAFLTGSVAVAFADSSPGERLRPGLAAFLARRFPEAAAPDWAPRAALADDHYGRWCQSLRDLWWVAATASAAPSAPRARPAPRPARAPRASWLPDAQWLVSPAGGPTAFGFAAKGGRNDESHNHNDIGSFQLALGGAQVFAELGAGEYTRDYFGAARYSILCNSSLGHSVPIVDGFGQEEGAERRARAVSYEPRGPGALLSMDISAAYPVPELVRLTRRFEFDGAASLDLRDEFDFRPGSGHRVVERFVTGLSAGAIRIEAGRVVLEAEGGRIHLTCSIEGLAPRLVLLEHRAHDGRAVPIACLDYELPVAAPSLSVAFGIRLEAG
jgi:hypothetical protein